jgi:TonB-dependent receptor
MHYRTTVSAALALSFFMAAGLHAQAPRGTIAGRVLDSTRGALQGARVEIRPAGIVTTTDTHGEFTVRDLRLGAETVVVTYVGFKVSETPVTVEAGDVKKLSITLEIASSQESILVTAERPRGEAEAINRTRSADNILQVLPSEVITSLPNANVADALGRLPSVTLGRDEGEGVYVQVRGAEPRLTNVTINGITVPSPEPTVRQVRLDALPAGIFDSVEINKTLTADQDGDGIGGSVNLRTKTATDAPLMLANVLYGHNRILDGRDNNQVDFTSGGRFGAQKTVGVLGAVSYDYNGRGIDDIEPAISPTSTFSKPLYDNDTVREYRYYRKRWGLSGSTDWKVNDFSDLYLSGLYTSLQDYGDKWYYGPQASGNPKFYTSSKRPEYSISSINGGGRHVMSSSWFNWEVAGARSYELSSAGNPKADFSWIGSKLTCGFNPAAQTDPYLPTFGNNCDAAGTPLQNASNWGFKDITTSTGQATQVNLSASASYGRQYRLGSHNATLQLGAKFRSGHKYQDASENIYDGWNAAQYPMTQFLNPFTNSSYYDHNYYSGHYGPVSDFDTIQNFTLQNLSAFLDGYKTAAASIPNDFDLTERIGAGFAMTTIDFAHVRLQGGVRVEQTNMITDGFHATLYPPGSANCPTPTGCGVATPVNATSSYTNLLPSASAVFAVTNDSQLRAVYSRALSRPDQYQLVPYVTEDDSTNPPTTAVGNPNLIAEHANNYDLLYERYLRPVGLLQAGVFAKQLRNPLAAVQTTASSDEYAGDAVTQWVNGGSAMLCGMELSYQQHLTYLPGWLGGFGVMTNYSWTTSHVDGLPGRADHPALQRQAANTWNLSPTYDRGKVSIRLGLTYNGPSIFMYAYQPGADPSGLGPAGPSGDQFTYPHLQVDLQGSYEVHRGLRIVAYGLNVNNEVYGLYAGSPQFVRQREFYQATVAVGIRYVLGTK